MADSNIEKRALALFEASLELPDDKREDWLRQRAVKDAALLKKVLELHATDSQPGSAILTGNVVLETELTDTVPERIGTYRITGVIGRGGMGAVYRGQRDSGDFDHLVAIKVIRSGVLSDALKQRFDRERQTLAQLIHPNIARLYDGGQTSDQNPYFVMEYVDGMPITQWVKQQELEETARIQLFIRACEAVRYAHQNLIVHRDITPSNVLVNQDGEVKLIDFGIAKPSMVDSEDVDASTSLASLSFTPGFAAPERAKGQGANTLADIYSLGKLLAAMLEDTKPSIELKAIIDMASAEQAEQRYQTVNDLKVDVVNYLEQQPVRAYSKNTSYALSKFIQRHKASAIFAASATLAVFVALVISIYQYQRAEAHLVDSQQRFNQVRELAKYQIFDLYDALKKVAGNTAIRANIAEKAQQYLANLNLQADASPDLQLETAQGYIRLARIYGVPAEPNMGDVVIARQNLTKAKSLLDSLTVTEPNWPDLSASRVNMMAASAMILVHDDSDLQQAVELTELAEKLLQKVPSAQRSRLWHLAQRNLRSAQFERADQAGDSATLRSLAAQYLAEHQRWPIELASSTLAVQDQGWYYYWIAMADYNDNLFAAAIRNFEQANQVLSELESKQRNDPMLLYSLAWTNYIAYGSAARLNDLDRSISFLDRATNYTAKLATVQEGDASIIRLGMQMREAKSQLLAEMGKFDEAIAMQEALVVDQEVQVQGKPEASQYETWAFSKIILAYMYLDVEQRVKACEQLEGAEKLLKPFADKLLLADYMLNAALRLDSRIQQCRAGEPIASMNALFD